MNLDKQHAKNVIQELMPMMLNPVKYVHHVKKEKHNLVLNQRLARVV